MDCDLKAEPRKVPWEKDRLIGQKLPPRHSFHGALNALSRVRIFERAFECHTVGNRRQTTDAPA